MTDKQTQGPAPEAGGSTRRAILQAGVVATGALAMPKSLAARARTARPGNPTKVTVVLFQRGGADHLNLYAPTGDSNYANLRPTVGVGAPGSGATVEGLAMNPTFSMHPAMPGTHAAFVAPGSRCGIVHAVGYAPPDLSHFESQSIYETTLSGVGAGGWINRHLQATSTAQDAPVRALAIRSALPESMWGPYPCYAVARTNDLVYTGPSDARAVLAKLSQGDQAVAQLPAQQAAYQSQRDTFALLDLFGGLDPENYVPANGAAYPESGLGSSLRQVAEVIKAGLGVEFFAVDQGGWDHHSDIVNRIAMNASDLDASITAFFDDLGLLADDVLLVTMSEFGRTAHENGSAGTDHGMGGAMLLRGGSVNGGVVHGNWPTVAPAALVSGNYLDPVNDFRDVLREVLDVHMGGTDPALVFPGWVNQPVGVL